MAPELIENAKCSTKVDVYSFGCVLYEIILGEHCYFDMELKGVAVMLGDRCHLVLSEGPTGNAADDRAGNACGWGLGPLLRDRAGLLDEAVLALGQGASHNEGDCADNQGMEPGDLEHECDARVPGTVVWRPPSLVFPLQVVACLVFSQCLFWIELCS
jgi:protein tyrosine kinase